MSQKLALICHASKQSCISDFNHERPIEKSFKILILQMEKSEILNHFKIEVYPRRTIYDTINRMQLGTTINDKKKTGRPASWTPARKNQLKRLANNRKGVSQES